MTAGCTHRRTFLRIYSKFKLGISMLKSTQQSKNYTKSPHRINLILSLLTPFICKYPRSGVVLDFIDSWSLSSFLFYSVNDLKKKIIPTGYRFFFFLYAITRWCHGTPSIKLKKKTLILFSAILIGPLVKWNVFYTPIKTNAYEYLISALISQC